MKPHAFVAMPFATKPGPDGQPIDFNRVYAEYIKPALEAAGLQVFRADEEQRAGDIRTDMFQELLVADLVVADLTIDNPNVWYELGVRHALRARGVVLVCGGRTTTAFDLYTDRKLRYGIANGGPDSATLEDDKFRLTAMVQATMESWHGRKLSPVYKLMPNLQEPDWKSLRIGDVREFWERHDAWEDRIELARQSGRIGDVLVLADEAPVAAFRAEAWLKAGEALRKCERFDFALEQLERGLEIEPLHFQGRREQGMCLQRLALAGRPGHSLDRARQHYRNMLEEHPNDAETWALLGRVDKDAWTSAWRVPGNTPEQMRGDAAYEDTLLRAAIQSYARAFCANPGHYYSGINVLTLMHLYRHLTGDARYDGEMATMAGIATFERALKRLIQPEERRQPRQVFLFSGHMIDAPDRETPRFPAEKEGIAAQKIAEALDRQAAGPEDLALAQAAAGGDLLFLEACRERGVRCQILLPFGEPDFIQRSILPSKGGDRWLDRFYALKAALPDAPRIMPDELGPPPQGVDSYERCNLWLLYTALASGVDKVRFLCLWNGGGGDGPGGTAHMYDEVQRRTGKVTWIDSRRL